ncbi:MAG: hypothetical protein ACK5MN_11935 [Lachnospiraceae bacterium]
MYKITASNTVLSVNRNSEFANIFNYFQEKQPEKEVDFHKPYQYSTLDTTPRFPVYSLG